MATKKGRIRPPGYTDIVHPETDADIVLYDNVVSGLTSGNVKDAIDELVSKLEGINNDAPDLDNSKTYRWGLRIQDGKTQFIYEEVI